jgi:hypothetical protein
MKDAMPTPTIRIGAIHSGAPKYECHANQHLDREPRGVVVAIEDVKCRREINFIDEDKGHQWSERHAQDYSLVPVHG